MEQVVGIEGFQNQIIEIKGSSWKAPKVLQNGQPVPKKRNMVTLANDFGQPVEAKIGQNLLSGPSLKIGANKYGPGAENSNAWYEYIIYFWSFILVIGGLLGVVCALFAVSANVAISKSSLPRLAKYSIATVLNIIAVVVYLIIASAISSAVT